jgi:hypothetical protein
VFETRWGKLIYSVYLILPAALDPGVHSAPNRNEYEKRENKVCGSKAQPVLRADNLTVTFEPFV